MGFVPFSSEVNEATHSPSNSVHTVTKSCYGVSLRFTADNTRLLRSIQTAIPGIFVQQIEAPLAVLSVTSADTNSYRVFLNDYCLHDALNSDQAVDLVARRVPEIVALLSSNLAFVHAGVVGWQGRAIVMPGQTWSGKTTLVKSLLDLGATYYSDEYALIGLDGLVRAYPRRLNLRDRPASDSTRPATSSGDFGVPPPPLPIGAVVATEFIRGSLWQPQQMSSREILFCLFENAIALRQKPELYLRALSKVSRSANGFRGQRGEADLIAKNMLKLTESLN